MHKSSAAFGVEARRRCRSFRRSFERPLHQTTEAVCALANFLVAFGPQNINCGLTRYPGWGRPQAQFALPLARRPSLTFISALRVEPTFTAIVACFPSSIW